MSGKGELPGNGREAALRALVRVEQDDAYLNLVLPSFLGGLAADERALAVKLAAGTIQRLNTIDWAISLFSDRSPHTFTPWIRNLLRLSAYQLLYLDRIPDYAVVDEAVRLARRFGHRGVAGLTNALLRRLAGEAASLPWPDQNKNPSLYLSLKHSQPQWLVSRMIKRFGFQEALKWCLAANIKPSTSLRPNILKSGPFELIEKLGKEGLEAFESPLIPGIVRIKRGDNPAAAQAFHQGLFTIQGESSALVAPLLLPDPGDTIIDSCSAPGGKATHLAELMGDKGQVYAVELQKSRLQLVKKAARRLGLQSVKPLLADSRSLEKQNLPAPAAVLVDAPCTGLGVIRRLPEIKWRRREKDLLAMQFLQLDLLRSAARILPPGGKLLYSVCTTEPEETEQVVEAFSRENPDFNLEELQGRLPAALQDDTSHGETVSLWPHRHDMDGFFMALWQKKNWK